MTNIYDMLLDRATEKVTDEQFDQYVSDHKLDDFSATHIQPLNEMRFSDIE
jgi:hypothetical protein